MDNELARQAAAAMAKQANPQIADGVQSVEITNENALVVIAQTLVGIERHLLALVYLENTKDSARTGVTYEPSVFASIYDGTDPFAEVDALLADLKANPKNEP